MGCGEVMKVVAMALMMMVGNVAAAPNYQRAFSSLKPKWRSHSAVHDGSDRGVNLVGGYYDAGGDNVKYNFPMAFTTTMLAWSVIDFGGNMGDALEAIKWATDYFHLCSNGGNTIYVRVGVGETRGYGHPQNICIN